MASKSSSYLETILESATTFGTTILRPFQDDQHPALDTLLRLVLGFSSPPSASSDLKQQWETQQKRVLLRIDELRQSTDTSNVGRKRRRDDADGREEVDGTAGAEDGPQKRLKSSASTPTPPRESSMSSAPASLEADPPLFTLHALSMTSPIRKKADITVHRSSIQLTQPGSATLLHPPIPMTALRRAFLLPTRGKSKPHWSILILPTDAPPTTTAKGKGKGKLSDPEASDDETQPQIAFGLDAVLAGLRSTKYDASSDTNEPTGTTTTLSKGSPVLPVLQEFLSHLPIQTLEPSTAVFRSAASGGTAGGSQQEGVAGIEAYRGAKPGTLWFLDEGVLWDGRPAEFFALRNLARPAVGEGGVDIEGVRTISATGRTCSVIMRRIYAPAGIAKDGGGEDQGSEDEEDQAIDVDFGMVDGREQEGIARWVKRRRHLFGQQGREAQDTSGAEELKPKRQADEDDSEEDDSDFVDASSSDGGSATSDSDDGSAVQGEDEGEEEASASEQEEETGEPDREEDGDGEEEEELKPEHHPLLRPGAMPRMSRAAMEAVVGMVEADMRGKAVPQDAEDSEDELDELDE